MAIPRSIKQYLFHHFVRYTRKTHPVAYTSQEIAEVDHIPGREFAKTVVIRADERMILAVLPGDYVINLEILRKQVGCDKLMVVPEKDFINKFPECHPGAMPPFGKLFGLPLYCDSTLAKQAEIEFNAGTHVDTIRMTFPSFVALEDPIMVRFSQKRAAPRIGRIA
jgi:Ala-tRNA(Pro) deacylase